MDCRLFNLIKVRRILIHVILFTDDAALATRYNEAPVTMISCFSEAYKGFELAISRRETHIMAQNVNLKGASMAALLVWYQSLHVWP